MGNSVSAILAILYMDRLETQPISTFHQIGLYKRYVDDILIITSNKEAADDIFSQMNAKIRTLNLKSNTRKITILFLYSTSK